MAGNENDRILRLRNETSLYLDDLVALVVNSSLSFDLRLFSGEIMEMRPGFAFSLKQAKTLRDMTQKILEQYRAQAIQDSDLMNYLSNAKMILKNGEQKNEGGKQMSIFNKLLHGKEIKQQETLEKLEQSYKDICEKILSCENDMARCIENARGCAPESLTYRNNERIYNNASNKLKLLTKQEKQMREILERAEQVSLVKDFKEQQEELKQVMGIVLGSGESMSRVIAEINNNDDKIKEKLSGFEELDVMMAEEPEETVRHESEFGVQVASSERRRELMNAAGVTEEEVKAAQAQSEQKSEFGKLVNTSKLKE